LSTGQVAALTSAQAAARRRWLGTILIKSGDLFADVAPVSGDEMISVITETVDQKSNGLSRPVKRAQRVFGTIRLQRNWLA